MQTITFNDSNISTYIFEDDVTISSTVDDITTPSFIIGDMNSDNATVHTGVTPPNDWMGGKYKFDGINWETNNNWDDPHEAEIAELQARIAELESQ